MRVGSKIRISLNKNLDDTKVTLGKVYKVVEVHINTWNDVWPVVIGNKGNRVYISPDHYVDIDYESECHNKVRELLGYKKVTTRELIIRSLRKYNGICMVHFEDCPKCPIGKKLGIEVCRKAESDDRLIAIGQVEGYIA